MRGSILANAKMPMAPAVKMMHSQRYGGTMPLSLLSFYSLQENRAGAPEPSVTGQTDANSPRMIHSEAE
jgi:hypothetical protein